MQIVAALIEALQQRGVRRVYGVPGDYVLGLFAALQASPLDLICTAGEEGAGFAADAHGRLQGLGVAVVTYGVGALKLLNPVAGAYAERSPLLVISGAPGLRESEEHPLLHHRIRADQTQLRLFREVTVASAVLDSGRTAAQELVRVLEAMRRESRPGYLEFPADCLSREIAWPIDFAPPAPAPAAPAIPESLQREGERWLAWLRGRQRPLVLGGVELARFGLQPLLQQILEREGWALATSLSGKSLLSESHPQVLGIYEGAMGEPAVRERVESSAGLQLQSQSLLRIPSLVRRRSPVNQSTTLFAALDVATGEVITQCKPRHRHQEFLGFLRQIEASVPEDLEIHLVVDNYCTHKHAKVRVWLAQRPRFHVHYTPTYASWLNQVQRWFGIITQRAIRRGSFSSVKELIARIEQFVAAYNKTKTPFNWTATADSILEKLQRLCAHISGTAH